MKKLYTSFLCGSILLLAGCGSSDPGEGQLEQYYSQSGKDIVSVEYAEHADGHIVKVNDEDYFFVSPERFAEIDNDNHVLIGLAFTEKAS